MSDVRATAVALAALEVLPAEPSDLTRVLVEVEQRAALLNLHQDGSSSELTAWLCEQIDHGRVELWEKRLEQLIAETPVRAVLAHEEDYPTRLRECWDRPPVLFLHGPLPPSRPAVGIVGSRAAAPETLQAAHQLGCAFAERRWMVVSGLAAGIDTAAHRGALAAGGHTVAVMGTGIRRVFPASNTDLADLITDSGALVSQFAPDAPRTSTTFLRRNHVIAGLVDVDLVMDGQERSGSRHQAEQAMTYGRPVLLWAPTLGDQPWARHAVGQDQAVFVHDVEEVLTTAHAVLPAAAVGAGSPA